MSKRLIDALELKRSIAASAVVENGKHIFDIIDEQPNIEPKLQWIPCYEKLPESYKDVLVYYEYYRYYDYGAMCQAYGIGFCSPEGTWHGDVSGTKARCLAWMPLPDAYKEDE